MQLNKLEIKGFKSFGDKITINFNEGVTAIVGPNGCGKSNVVDAIRWVLGEQSTKNLRSEKMENIIFNGTKTRKAANLAEVSLSFDNTKNVLPTEFSQVTITRKLYRNGDSEYRLNDVKCRLKDITDLFLDTGIGTDSYSIIELKMIDEIINNKDHSRRNLFEEASGIAKYKIRKKQTLNKLKDTENDLERVADLLYEIEKNLKVLENQAKKTERYYKIKEQYKSLSVALASKKIISFRDALTAIEKQESTHIDGQTKVATLIHQAEAYLQQQKQVVLNKEKNLSIQQKATHAHISKIRAYESDKKVKNEQLKNFQQQEVRLNNELQQDRQQLNHVLYNIKRLNEERLEEANKLEQATTIFETHKTAVDTLRQQQQAEKIKLEEMGKMQQRSQQKKYQLEKNIAVLKIQQDALTQEISRSIADVADKSTALDQFNLHVARVETQTDTLQAEYELLVAQESELQENLINTETHLQALKEEINADQRTLDAKQNEYNLTKSLVDNLEGFPESIRFLRKNVTWRKNYPLFSDVLFCQEEYRIAIENFLEPIMNHYVVEQQEEAIHAISLLSDSSRGRANFFVLEAIRNASKSQLATPEHEHLIPALTVVTMDPKYADLIELLLANVYISKQDDDQELKTSLPENDWIILNKSGKFSKNRLGMSGGSVGLFEGKRIGRAKNLDDLSKSIKSLTKHITGLHSQLEESGRKLTSLKTCSQKIVIEEKKLQLNRLHQELITVKTKQEQYLEFIHNSQNRKADIDEKLTQIQKDVQQFEPELIILEAQITEGEAQLQAQQAAYQQLSENLTEQVTRYNQENIKLHQQQNKLSGIDKDIEYRQRLLENHETRIATNAVALAEAQAGIKDTLQHVDTSDEDLVAMYEQKETLEKGLQDLEEEFHALRLQINETETNIGQHRKDKELADQLLNDIREKKMALKMDLNALKERLSVEFDVDITDLLDTDDSEFADDEETLVSKTEKMKRQLDDFGSINPMAMEAYQEMNERFTFITKEKQDLLDAKTSLLETIAEIDDTAKEKFMEAFTRVRENFIRVFRSLFNEEDNCDLVLSNSKEPLESDIDIIAKPKGKRPLSINQLSGGEKTLTATALLFALYLLKPAPFCIFDEVDAPLDDTNIDKFNNIIREFSGQSQFIIVSHNKRTIASTDIIYGVTMVEQGISRVVAVDMRDVA